ncbi:hypothetical protein N7512_005427 [Penicillium capsulatum]|nr:hypothetical protein N7512_005427 [Penicillium capsulatum]
MSNTPHSPVSQNPATEADLESTDDWAGLTDPIERRRRQNRINQRARRRRQRMQSNNDKNDANSHTDPSTSTAVVAAGSISSNSTVSPSSSTSPPKVNACLSPQFVRVMLEQFVQNAYASYILGSPTADHLLTLTKANVFRAFAHNLKLVGGSLDDMDDDSLSHFSMQMPRQDGSPQDYSNLPVNLRPTKLQRTVAHHPWLDFFPIPKMRDNCIQAGDNWDDDQLCHDIMGFWDSKTDDAGLLVWGDPADINSWEVTETFLKKWQWVIRGCPELMNSTNAWRSRRGEKLIFRYI